MLKKKSSGDIKYLKVTKGNFYLTSDKELENPFEEVEGTLVDLYLKDENIQGTTVRKLYAVIQDGLEKAVLGLRFESREATMLLNFLKNADLQNTLAIRAGSKKEKDANGEDVLRTKLFVNQNGENLKSAYTKDNPNGLPEMKKIKLNGKYVWDKEDYLGFYENLVTKTLKPQLRSTPVITPAANSTVTEGEPIDEDDDLPF